MTLRTTFAWVLIVTAACGPNQGPAESPPAGRSQLTAVDASNLWKERRLAEVDEAERRWRAWKIRDYRIVFDFSSVWSSSRHEVTFRNDRMVTGWADIGVGLIGTPSPGRRRYEMDVTEGEAFTVPGLLAKVRSVIRRSTNPNDLTVRFHPTYGYPQETSYDEPDSIDEEAWSKVKAFEVIPASR